VTRETTTREITAMEIYSIWESRFPSEAAGEGLEVTEAIWEDMPDFDGYRDHVILVDQDDHGHLLVVSRWASREHADKVLREYSPHPNARAADHLVSQPGHRYVAVPARRQSS
jgi:heme-degrading monooxygenase HmoA